MVQCRTYYMLATIRNSLTFSSICNYKDRCQIDLRSVLHSHIDRSPLLLESLDCIPIIITINRGCDSLCNILYKVFADSADEISSRDQDQRLARFFFNVSIIIS